MQVILITHAHTEIEREADSRVWQLSDEGRTQALELAQADFWPEVNRVVVSSEPKTRLTIEAVCRQYDLPIWVDDRFDELRRGGWIENYEAAVRAALGHPDVSYAGWERATDALRRGLDGLASLSGRYPGETVALVGHGLQLMLLRAHWMGHKTVDPDEWARLPFAGFARIDLDGPHILADFPLGGPARTRR